MPELEFSAHPGAWERHLLRRNANPLFAPEKRRVTQAEVEAAQARDAVERRDFAGAFQALLQEVSSLAPQVEGEVVLKLKERIDRLYEQCAGLGADFAFAKEGLEKLNGLIMQAIRNSGAHDAHAQMELEKETAARKAHYALLAHPLIADLLRPDSPIPPEDLVPTLLSEDSAALHAAMSVFDTALQQELLNKAQTLLDHLQQQGLALPWARQRLAVMRQTALAAARPV